MHKYIR